MKWNYIRTNWVYLISIILYLFSMSQDAYYTNSHNPSGWAPSYGLLFFGWLGFLQAPSSSAIAWLANPALIYSWIAYSKNKIKHAAIFSVFATILATSFLAFQKVIIDMGPVFKNISSYEYGYWVWLTSCLIMSAASIEKALTNNIKVEVETDAE